MQTRLKELLLCMLFGGLLTAAAIWYSPRLYNQKGLNTAEDVGVFLFFSKASIQVSSRVHFKGHVWVITKVVLQDADDWILKNKEYYFKHPGPRLERENDIHLEAPQQPIIDQSFAVFGVAVD